MKGLLYKDILLFWKYCKSIIVIAGLCLFASVVANKDNFFLVVYPCVLGVNGVITLISSDERNKWNVYSDAMPVSRRMRVSSKYLVCLIIQMALLILTVGIQLLVEKATGNFAWAAVNYMIGTMSVVAFAAPAAMLPWVFALGVEKGRIAYIIMMGLVFGFGAVILEPDMERKVLEMETWPWIMCAVSVILYFISWLVSVKLFEKREL